jgi:hypothetical protein
MQYYWMFWRRGWWAWLFMLAVNVTGVAAFALIAFVSGGEGAPYIIGAIVFGLVVLVPLVGWIFEQFAANSARLVAARARITDTE